MDDVKSDIQYTFYEISEILKNIPTKYSNKLPESLKKFINENQISNDFEYDDSKTLDCQNMLQDTKTLLSIFYRTYWCSTEQRKKLEEEDNKILADKYSTDNIFNKRKPANNEDETNLIEYKESIFHKIISKIKYFFRKK